MHASLCHMVTFKKGTLPCLQPHGGFLWEQEGFCTLQKQPSENTDMGHSACLHDSILSTMGYPPLCVL